MKLKRKSQNQKVGDEVVKQMKSSHAAILTSAVSHTDLAKIAMSDVIATRKQPAIVTPLFSKLSPGVVPPRSIMSSAAPAPKKPLPAAEARTQSFAVQDPAVPRSLNTASPHTVAVLRVHCVLSVPVSFNAAMCAQAAGLAVSPRNRTARTPAVLW